MRLAIIMLAACGGEALPPSQPIHLEPKPEPGVTHSDTKRIWTTKQTIVVFGVEGSQVLARELTFRLRNEVREEPRFQLLPIDREITDEKLIKNCADITPADQHPKKCLIEIGREAGADYLLWGDLQEDHGAFQARVQLIPIADPEANRRAIYPIRDPAAAEPATHKAWPTLLPP